MRMTDHETTPTTPDIPAVWHGATPPADPSSADGATRSPGGASNMGERSLQTHDLQRARSIAQAASEIRGARVEAARRALQEGTLTLDGLALAEKLLEAVRAERRHA